MPDSRGQIWPRSPARPLRAAPMARRYSARCACVSRGQGPSSNASRAASTARAMSAACASATLKYSFSVPESITSIMASDEGLTHSPPMKNRSGLRNGALTSSVRLMLVTSRSSGRNLLLLGGRDGHHVRLGELAQPLAAELTAYPALVEPAERGALVDRGGVVVVEEGDAGPQLPGDLHRVLGVARPDR